MDYYLSFHRQLFRPEVVLYPLNTSSLIFKKYMGSVTFKIVVVFICVTEENVQCVVNTPIK